MALKMETGLILIAMTMLFTGAMAQSGCTNVLISLSPCLNYITGNSSTPPSSCCTQLESVVRSSPQCLCTVLNAGGQAIGGLNINRTQALELPKACNVQTPPVSRCNASSPADAPGTSDTPNTSGPTGNGSKTVPSTDNTASDGNSTKFTFSLFFFLLFIASFAST